MSVGVGRPAWLAAAATLLGVALSWWVVAFNDSHVSYEVNSAIVVFATVLIAGAGLFVLWEARLRLWSRQLGRLERAGAIALYPEAWFGCALTTTVVGALGIRWATMREPYLVMSAAAGVLAGLALLFPKIYTLLSPNPRLHLPDTVERIDTRESLKFLGNKKSFNVLFGNDKEGASNDARHRLGQLRREPVYYCRDYSGFDAVISAVLTWGSKESLKALAKKATMLGVSVPRTNRDETILAHHVQGLGTFINGQACVQDYYAGLHLAVPGLTHEQLLAYPDYFDHYLTPIVLHERMGHGFIGVCTGWGGLLTSLMNGLRAITPQMLEVAGDAAFINRQLNARWGVLFRCSLLTEEGFGTWMGITAPGRLNLNGNRTGREKHLPWYAELVLKMNYLDLHAAVERKLSKIASSLGTTDPDATRDLEELIKVLAILVPEATPATPLPSVEDREEITFKAFRTNHLVNRLGFRACVVEEFMEPLQYVVGALFITKLARNMKSTFVPYAMELATLPRLWKRGLVDDIVRHDDANLLDSDQRKKICGHWPSFEVDVRLIQLACIPESNTGTRQAIAAWAEQVWQMPAPR